MKTWHITEMIDGAVVGKQAIEGAGLGGATSTS
jgi:hypothetical protein